MKKLRLPKKVKIGHVEYKIIYPYIFEYSDTKECTGLHTPSNCTIKISREASDGRKRNNIRVLETFMHEILHAIDSVYMNDIFEENHVSRFSTCLTNFFLDNPHWNISENTIPDYLEIGPYIYTIKYPYNDDDFPDISYLGDNTGCIYYLKGSWHNNDINIDLVKANLMVLVLTSIDYEYVICAHEEEEVLEEVRETFAKGIIQVFKDNKLNKLINKQRNLFYG